MNRAKEGGSTSTSAPLAGTGGKGGEKDVERDVPRGAKKQRSGQQNIVVLSSSPTALVTMWNVKRLLEDGE